MSDTTLNNETAEQVQKSNGPENVGRICPRCGRNIPPTWNQCACIHYDNTSAYLRMGGGGMR